jgi:hypothetical protein
LAQPTADLPDDKLPPPAVTAGGGLLHVGSDNDRNKTMEHKEDGDGGCRCHTYLLYLVL